MSADPQESQPQESGFPLNDYKPQGKEKQPALAGLPLDQHRRSQCAPRDQP